MHAGVMGLRTHLGLASGLCICHSIKHVADALHCAHGHTVHRGACHAPEVASTCKRHAQFVLLLWFDLTLQAAQLYRWCSNASVCIHEAGNPEMM
jgi:hypothetical protein